MTDIITMIANIALALSFAVGLIFGIAQVKTAARDRRERLTIQTVHDFQSREFVDLMQYVLTAEMPVNREGLWALSVKEQTDLMQFAQQMESLGILVAEQLINIDLVDKTLGSFVTTSWEKYKTLFLNIREVTPDPFLGEYFQWLAERIDERMKETPRQPYYLTGRS